MLLLLQKKKKVSAQDGSFCHCTRNLLLIFVHIHLDKITSMAVLFNCVANREREKKSTMFHKKVHRLPNIQTSTFVRRHLWRWNKTDSTRKKNEEKKTHQFRKNRFMSWRIQMNVCSEIKTLENLIALFLSLFVRWRSPSPCQALYLFFISCIFFFSCYIAKGTLPLPVSYALLISIRLMICRPHQWKRIQALSHGKTRFIGKKWMEKSETLFFFFSLSPVKYAIYSICFRDLPCSTLVKLCVSFVIFSQLSPVRCHWKGECSACVSNLVFSHFAFLQKTLFMSWIFWRIIIFSWMACISV